MGLYPCADRYAVTRSFGPAFALGSREIDVRVVFRCVFIEEIALQGDQVVEVCERSFVDAQHVASVRSGLPGMPGCLNRAKG